MPPIRQQIFQFPKTLKKAFGLLQENNPIILASSTAFFAMFSLSPIIVILVNALSLYFKSENISEELFKKIQDIFGKEAANQIESIVSNFRSFDSQWWITVGGSIFLFFVATTLLRVVKLSIHQLWNIRKSPVNQIRYTIRERLISSGLVLAMGVLFAVSLLLDASIAFLKDYLEDLVPFMDVAVIRLINHAFSLVVLTTWFTIIYKVLPDAVVSWKVAWPGGVLTAILFYLGEFILGKLLLYRNLASFFEASASVALILLFIFYSSLIIYFGAAFTHVYAEFVKKPIKPGKLADEYEMKRVEHSAEH